MNNEPSAVSEDPKSTPLLKEIRERYAYALNAWKDVREEAKIDMKYVAGDPWTEEDKQQRKEAGRPCVSFDEINQYLNQAINNIRQNKRAIKVNPKGSGADDKTAEFNENLIRGIEYDSQAQRNAYIPAFENAVNKSYGFFRITREYSGAKSFDQVIKIKGILNSDTVLYDPDCQEADWSDAGYCFVHSPIKWADFKAKYPKAQFTSFDAEDAKIAPEFVREGHVVLAEYWKAERVTKKLHLVESENGPQVYFDDELPEGAKPVKSRDVEERKITQYITNGIEILEENEQPGTYIPIVPVIGKEIFVDSGRGPQRQLISLVRLARDPQMAYAYMASSQMEEVGQTPKSPFLGYKGQFESDKDHFETVNKVPYGYLEVDPVVDAVSNQVLPLPTRPQFIPNIQAYEVGKESVRRAIQASMGIMPLPTAAARQNEKSGKALDRIQQQEQIGSFHFTDNLDRALELAGRIILEWIPIVYDTAREVSLRKNDDSHEVVPINQDGAHQSDAGEHSVTISVGPSFQSQRDEANDFVDTLMSNLKGLPLPPPQLAALLAQAIKLKNLGPIGDEIAKIIDPNIESDEPIPPQAQQAIGQLQQQMQALNAACQHYEQKIQELEFEKKAKILDNEQKLAIEKLHSETQITLAEVNTKAQNVAERIEFISDMVQKLMDHQHEAGMTVANQQHEVGMQQADQAHEQDLAQQQAESAQAQQMTQIAADQQAQQQQGQ